MNAAVMSVLSASGKADGEGEGDKRLAACAGWTCVLALRVYAAASHCVSEGRG